MNERDYREIIQMTRSRLIALGYETLDERIASNLRGFDGAYEGLVFYLKRLREEILLGSDKEYRGTLERFRQYVVTETGRPVSEIRVEFTLEDAALYGTRVLEFVPSRELEEIAAELNAVLEFLSNDYSGTSDSDAGI